TIDMSETTETGTAAANSSAKQKPEPVEDSAHGNHNGVEPSAGDSVNGQIPKKEKSTENGGGVDLNSDDVVTTSHKAYEHFVKMQHDLEMLMRNEEKYRARIEELQKENQELAAEKEEDEFKLSEVQYELDILKHNYNLEMESF